MKNHTKSTLHLKILIKAIDAFIILLQKQKNFLVNNSIGCS